MQHTEIEMRTFDTLDRTLWAIQCQVFNSWMKTSPTAVSRREAEGVFSLLFVTEVFQLWSEISDGTAVAFTALAHNVTWQIDKTAPDMSI